MKNIILSKKCQKCKGLLKLNTKHDAEFCEICNEWIEDACKDPSCEFCSSRPRSPSDVKETQDAKYH